MKLNLGLDAKYVVEKHKPEPWTEALLRLFGVL